MLLQEGAPSDWGGGVSARIGPSHSLRESDGEFKVEQLMGDGIGVRMGWGDKAESASTGLRDVSA